MANTITLEASNGQLITIPDFDFSGFYYPEVLLSLLEYTRVNTPELTSEDEHESHIQLLRAFSLVAHLSNTRQDVVANELLLESAQLRESVRRLIRLIDVDLASAKPASTELVMGLTTITTSDISIFIAQDSAFATRPDDDGDIIEYQIPEDLSLGRGDQIDYVFGEEHRVNATDGVTSSAAPTRLTSASALFEAADIGRRLLITNSANGNAGEFEITNFVDTSNIEVSGANFITETGLYWSITEFTTNQEAAANDGVTTFSPTVDIEQSFIYIGHDDLVWEQMDVEMDTFAASMLGIWEYYDPTFGNAFPDSVTDLGGTIEAVVDSLLGSGRNFGGSNVICRLTYNQTGRSEQLPVTWDGTNNIITTRAFLGQTSFDTDQRNYTISVDWVPLENLVDGTIFSLDAGSFSQDGAITYRLPKTRTTKWQKSSINGVEAYFLRFRWVETTAAITQPVFLRLRIDQGRQFFPFDVVQGETIRDELVGSSNGLPSQEFQLARGPLFDGTQVIQVDETGAQNFVNWSAVDNFLKSRATDRHYTIRADEDGIATIKFGGSNSKGRIPPLGTDNIKALEYRIGGDLDGNVGFDEIVEDLSGITFSSFVTNPMGATGWKEKEGGTPEDLERVKDAAPAEIRAEKAIATSDMARIAVDEYVALDGSSPVARAFAIEEAFGVKTVQLTVVGSGGGFLTVEELAELDTFFNGDQFTIPPVDGIILTGQELTSVNYAPREIDVNVTVTGKGLTVNGLRNAITNHIDPLATDVEGNFVHKFGQVFAVVLLDCAIRDAGIDQGGTVTNIVRTTPASDIVLGPNELPVAGTITVTIVEG